MNKIELIQKLNMLEYFILDNSYIEDWDGNDEETNRPIIRNVYVGLNEDQLKSLLVNIGDIIESIKEEM